MTSADLPPPREADEEWIDEAILVAILSLQFGNAAGRRASKAMRDAVRGDVMEAVRSMGRNPSVARIRAAIARIQRAFVRGARAVKRSITRDSRTLVGIEAAALPSGVKKPTAAELVAALSGRVIVGRTMDDYLETWIRRGASGRVEAIVRRLALTGASASAIAREVARDIAKTSRAVSAMAQTVMNDTSVMVRRKAATGKKLLWISVLDEKTTLTCIALDGETWPEEEPHVMPPVHINCRSTVGIYMGEEGGKPKMPKYVDWLKRQGKDVQNTVLGVERAEAWRQGSLPVKHMVDATKTRALTMDALRKMGRL